jgi:hypothetical protein
VPAGAISAPRLAGGRWATELHQVHEEGKCRLGDGRRADHHPEIPIASVRAVRDNVADGRRVPESSNAVDDLRRWWCHRPRGADDEADKQRQRHVWTQRRTLDVLGIEPMRRISRWLPGSPPRGAARAGGGGALPMHGGGACTSLTTSQCQSRILIDLKLRGTGTFFVLASV